LALLAACIMPLAGSAFVCLAHLVLFPFLLRGRMPDPQRSTKASVDGIPAMMDDA
jgi:hypothetical protein